MQNWAAMVQPLHCMKPASNHAYTNPSLYRHLQCQGLHAKSARTGTMPSGQYIGHIICRHCTINQCHTLHCSRPALESACHTQTAPLSSPQRCHVHQHSRFPASARTSCQTNWKRLVHITKHTHNLCTQYACSQAHSSPSKPAACTWPFHLALDQLVLRAAARWREPGRDSALLVHAGGRGGRVEPDRLAASAAHRAAVTLQRACITRDDVTAGERRIAGALHAYGALAHVTALLVMRKRTLQHPLAVLLLLGFDPLHPTECTPSTSRETHGEDALA